MKKFKQYNEDYAKSVSRDEYIKELSQHEHLKDNHGEVWDYFNGEKKEEIAEPAAEKVEGNVINKKASK